MEAPANWEPVNELHAEAADALEGWFEVKKKEKGVLEAIVWNDRMRVAWHLLARVRSGASPLDFLHACAKAVSDYENSIKQTTKEHREYFERLADNADELSIAVESDQRLLDAVGDLRALERALEGVSYFEHVFTERLNELYRSKTLPAELSYLPRLLSEDAVSVAPRTSGLLQALAEVARAIAEQGPRAYHPGKKTAARNFFIRRLVSFFNHPLRRDRLELSAQDEIVSAACAAVFGEEVESRVIADIRQRSRPGSKSLNAT